MAIMVLTRQEAGDLRGLLVAYPDASVCGCGCGAVWPRPYEHRGWPGSASRGLQSHYLNIGAFVEAGVRALCAMKIGSARDEQGRYHSVRCQRCNNEYVPAKPTADLRQLEAEAGWTWVVGEGSEQPGGWKLSGYVCTVCLPTKRRRR